MIDLSPGDRVGGYVIEDLIARGGMGVLYRASQPSLRRRVALKLIAPELASDQDFRRRFEREARLAASIDHPNVIPVFEAGEGDGHLFIAMRYVEGTDLRETLAGGRLGVSRALSIVDSVAAALDASHAAGLVHRDVKPANVLIAKGSEHVYLTDFGLARSSIGSTTSERTKAGQWMGTLGYVAPEQIQGGEVDGRADVYSLACVAFELLTGQPPFAGDDVHRLWQHVHADAPPPSGLDPSLGAFDAPLAQALAKDRTHRQASAGDLAAGLRAAARGEAPTAPPRGARTAATRALPAKPPSRLRRMAVPLAVVAAAAGGIALGSLVLSDDEPAPTETSDELPGGQLLTVREVYPEGGFETRRPVGWTENGTDLAGGYRVEFVSPDGERITIDHTDLDSPTLPKGSVETKREDPEVNTGAREGTGKEVEFSDGACPDRCVALLFRTGDGDGYLVWGPASVKSTINVVAARLIDTPAP